MNVVQQVWLPALLARIGAQREGSRARRAAFVCWVCVPVYLLFSFWSLGGWFIAVDDPTLDGKTLSYVTLYGFLMTAAWVCAAVYGLQVDHLRRPDTLYTRLVLIGYAITTSLTCYLVGTLNIISGLVMMGAPLLGMMLFPMREILLTFSFAIAAVLGASVASALGYLPYAPVLNTGLATTSAPGLYYAMSGIVGSALYVTYEVLIMAALVSASRFREADAMRIAVTDELTGLANRRQILNELERLLAATAVDGRSMAIVLVDIDDFRMIGKQYGHRTADQALVAAARALRGCLRSKDLVGRFDGDEFLVILPNTLPAAAQEVAQRCQQAVRHCGPDVDGQHITMHVSVGVATGNTVEARSVDELLRQATAMLLRARQESTGNTG